MDQVDASQPLETPTSVEKPSHTNDIPSTIDAAQKRPEADQDHPPLSEKIESRPVGVDDVDEVQIIFSVPRRRKKKRKRLEYPHSSAESPRSSQRPESEPLASRIPTSEGLLGASRTLGDSLSREESAVSTSIFTPSSSALHLNPNMPHLSFGPTYGYAQTPHSAALASSSIPWWDSARSQSNPILDRDRRNWPFEEVVGKKRRHDYEWEMPAQQRTEFRQSSQISPRTIPMATRAPLEYNSMSTGIDSVDLLGRPNHSLLATNLWPSFDWDAFSDANTNQFISQSLEQATVPMESSKVSKVCNGSSSQLQSRKDLRQEQMSPLRTWRSGQQAEIPTMEKALPTVGNALQVKRLSGLERENDVIANKSLPRTGDQITLQDSYQRDPVPTSPCKRLDIMTLQPESDGIAVIRTSSPKASSRTMRTPDILRKPSLYKIPPWQSSSAALSDPSPSLCNEATNNRVPGSNNVPRDTRTEAARKDDALSNSSAAETQRPKSQIPVTSINRLASTQQNVPSKNSSHASAGVFHIPKARHSRKHSPNLIIDIAETCQELFPFAAVAERHKVPIKKVFDTFSAIIQLPLLRNADDRRRHGSLGKLRVKEYRDAKKAMERAQEEERKAQMKAMRARVEEAARKGKAQAQTGPLLKTAIFNNAKDTQNGVGGS